MFLSKRFKTKTFWYHGGISALGADETFEIQFVANRMNEMNILVTDQSGRKYAGGYFVFEYAQPVSQPKLDLSFVPPTDTSSMTRELEEKIGGWGKASEPAFPVGAKASESLFIVPTKPVEGSLVSRKSSYDFSKIAIALGKISPDKLDVTSLPGFELATCIKKADITNATFSWGTTPDPWLCISGEASIAFPRFEDIGNFPGKFFAFVRNTTEGLFPGVVFFPSKEAMTKTGLFSREPLKTLVTDKFILVYSPKAHSYTFQDLPPGVRNEIAAKTAIDSGRILFEEGTGFVFGSRPQDVKGLRDFFKAVGGSAETLIVTGTRPKLPTESLRIRASFQSGINSKILPPGLTIRDVEFELNGLKPAFLGKIDIKLSESIHLDGLGLQIDLPGLFGERFTGFTVTASIPGEWRNPFGIKGLSIRGLELSGQIGLDAGIFLKGVIDFGRTLTLKAGLSFTSPVAVSALSGAIDQLSLRDIINAVVELMRQSAKAVKLPDPGSANIPIDIIRVNDAEFTIAKTSNPALNLKEGVTIRGKLNIADADVGMVDIRESLTRAFTQKGSSRGSISAPSR